MDANNTLLEEFRAYWRLSEDMIANATKEEVAEAARILAMQAAHLARNYGELQLPDLATLLSATTPDGDSVGLLLDGTEALVGVLAIVSGGELADADLPMQFRRARTQVRFGVNRVSEFNRRTMKLVLAPARYGNGRCARRSGRERCTIDIWAQAT